MSLVDISLQPPPLVPVRGGEEGAVEIDPRSWFQVTESMRRVDLAIQALERQQAALEENPVRVYPSVAYPRTSQADLSTYSQDANQQFHPCNVGPFAGNMQASVASMPSAWTSAEFVARTGEDRTDNTQFIQCGASATVNANNAGLFVWTTTIPYGFTAWGTEGIVAYWGLGVTGATTSGSATATLTAQSSVSGIADVTATSPAASESGGVISLAYGQKLALKGNDLASLNAVPGASIQVFLSFQFSGVSATSSTKFIMGRVEHNWR